MDQIPLKQLHESPFNVRKTAGPLDDLVKSVKQHGILQSILARPVGDHLEIVVGHRRFRAARQAGLSKVPVEVRKLDEKEARELQLVENLQREDIHPMEEAEGYAALQAEHGYTPEQIAEKIGKSESWVRGRLSYLELPEDARKAFYRGDLTPTTALLIARLRRKGERVQLAGLKHITQRNRWGDVMPHREAAAALKRLLDEETPERKATQAAGAKLVSVVRARTRDYAIRQIVERIERKPDLAPADLRLILTARLEEGVPASVLARRGVDTAKQLERKLAGMGGAELRGLLVELDLTAWLEDDEDVTSARLKVACKANGLEHREIETTVRELLAKEENVGKAEALFTQTR
jgi:ParB/RepB/Spo0J family partition protein